MYFIRMKGLPWHSSVEDVINFYQVKIEPKWVHIIKMPDGRDSGECLVGIEPEEEFQNCMACDKHFMGKRYIELYEASQQEWERITNRIHRTNKVPIDPNAFVILMRGLPYSAQEDDCISFFGGIPCLGVHLSKDRFGRASGQGYAEFPNEENFNAALQLDRSHMQNRYIELFKSSVADLVAAMRPPQEGYKNRRQKNNNNNHMPPHFQGGIITNPYQNPMQNPHRNAVMNGGRNKQRERYVVSVLGLPPGIQEADVRVFFEIEDVFPIRIHLKQGGEEAFIEIHDHQEMQKALSLSKTQLKGHIVEIYRSNVQDMLSKMGTPQKRIQTGGGNFGFARGNRKYAKQFSKKDPGLSLDLEHRGMGAHGYMANPAGVYHPGGAPHGFHDFQNQRRESPVGAGYAPPPQALSMHGTFPANRSPSTAFVPPPPIPTAAGTRPMPLNIAGTPTPVFVDGTPTPVFSDHYSHDDLKPKSPGGFTTGLGYAPISPTYPYTMQSFANPVMPDGISGATSPATMPSPGGVQFPVYSPSPNLNSFFFPPAGGLTKTHHGPISHQASPAHDLAQHLHPALTPIPLVDRSLYQSMFAQRFRSMHPC